MKMTPLGQILVVVVLSVTLLPAEVQGNNTKATVVAEVNGSGHANGIAKAVTDGKTGSGNSEANVRVVGKDGGSVKGEVTAVSKDGGDAKASLAVEAADGATVDSKVAAVAEGEGATAVLEKVIAANGNVDVATVSVKQAIAKGNGVVAARILDKAFVNGKLVHEDVREVVYVSLVKAVDDHSIDRYAIAKFIYQAVSSSEGNPAAFVKLLARLVKERDCDYVFLILEEVERLAVADGKDEFLLSMIYNERPLVRCFYPACSTHEPCCSINRIKTNFCELCPMNGMCDYKSYGKKYIDVLKTAPDTKGVIKKCACPV